eukprot:6357176-Amphidinium_carterae.1
MHSNETPPKEPISNLKLQLHPHPYNPDSLRSDCWLLCWSLRFPKVRHWSRSHVQPDLLAWKDGGHEELHGVSPGRKNPRGLHNRLRASDTLVLTHCPSTILIQSPLCNPLILRRVPQYSASVSVKAERLHTKLKVQPDACCMRTLQNRKRHPKESNTQEFTQNRHPPNDDKRLESSRNVKI